MDVKCEWNLETARAVVPWKTGLALPARFSAICDGDDVAYGAELEVEVRNGRPVCTRLTLTEHPGGPPISSRELRAVRLSWYLGLAAAACALRMDRLPDGSISVEPAIGEEIIVERADIEGPRGGRRRLSDEHLIEVAAVYRAALERKSRAPRKAIESDPRWLPSPATAARWVQEARKRKFLGPATPRRAGA